MTNTYSTEVDNGSIIDVMVVYTSALLEDRGGEAALKELIAIAAQKANESYQNSGVNQRIRIVHSGEVSYNESGDSGTDLARLKESDDTFLDEVHQLRDTYSADMVCLWTKELETGIGGQAYLMGDPSLETNGYNFADLAFSIIRADRAVDDEYIFRAFAHELGHNQGAGHDPENGDGAYPYSHCYQDPDREFRTIMAYNDGEYPEIPIINYWSNPDLFYNGKPLGVAGKSDNRLTLNNTAIYAANWRHSNDNFTQAKEISGASITTSGLNLNGTKELDEPILPFSAVGQSMWWSWTASDSNTVTFTTTGSNFDTLLGIYTGASIGGLSLIATNNDDTSGGITSQVSFNTIAGTTYKILVDGFMGTQNQTSGQIFLNLTESPQLSKPQPPNPTEPEPLNPAEPELPGPVDFSSPNTIQGTDEPDTLEGSSPDNTILGYQGNDELYGLDGNDILYGGKQNDRLFGGAGNDKLLGGDDDDELQGGEGDDTLWGGEGYDLLLGDVGNDILLGEAGDDILYGEEGEDQLRGGDGNDTLYGGKDNDLLFGQLGNDIVKGDKGDDTVSGNEGDDTLYGGEGDDKLYGGKDNDTLFGELGDDLLLGDNGDDTLYGEEGDDELQGGEGDDTLYGGKDNDTLFGESGDDILNGDNGDDILVGGEGKNQLQGGEGKDTLFGGSDNDFLNGGAGADYLDGGDGIDTAAYQGSNKGVNVSLASGFGSGGDAEGDVLTKIENLDGSQQDDILIGDSSTNQLSGLEGNDSLYGNDGNDRLYGDAGDDFLHGGNGTDDLNGGEGDDQLYGNQENDQLYGGDGNDTLWGGTDNDTLYGESGNDSLNGDEGEDFLDGGAGDDTLSGQEGYDYLVGGAGGDTLDGGESIDIASYYNSSTGVNVSLATGMVSGGDAEGDVLSNIENLDGSVYNDTLTGDDNNNTLRGFAGADILDGGDGIDTASYEGSSTSVNVSLATHTGKEGDAEGDMLTNIENLFGSSYDDTLIGNNDNNVLQGFAGNDTLSGQEGYDYLVGGAGGDTLDGGESIDIASYYNSSTGVNVSLATGMVSGGDAEGDVLSNIENLHGSKYDDILAGDGGNNLLEGWDGNDTLSGLEGDDYLVGGAGNDTLTGGIGDDIFVFAQDSGIDVIGDFTLGQDFIDLTDYGFVFGSTSPSITDEGSNTLIDLDGTNKLTLTGVVGITFDSSVFIV